MPELPETETIARDLHDMVVGAVVSGVSVPRPDVLREADARGFTEALAGQSIRRVWRRAKLIVLDVDSRPDAAGAVPAWRIVVQPRFTGGLVVDDGSMPAEEHAYRCVTFALHDGRALHYRDVRRLGTVALMDAPRFVAYSGALGLEPLDPATDDAAFSGCVRASRQAIKIALMDQKRLAGVGNIYANEALWLAGIDPSREACTLSPQELSRLRTELRAVLTASIAARGTSFRDYRDARGERGRFVEQLAAYGRAGAPCRRCGRRLVGTHAVDGRSTVFCPGCQY
ncbi:bifunctional DNA-formamidopyrimidine glycosylase/DNA-(apurinic or apyrimidinic site) lyase [Gemmatimonas sp.]|uniref:bifunctional DNA-formamidopyrimidine glycosylase/DNA-(apurinic or apyrimidinic site) lyase n=1 Tax=Gemmatimonas sp. TaxID=1962908 RepID=UPI0025BA553D|nr:bifunctional DNA-formamidopyrimidine glycosylase/DNA-(apurinic or apyrimidinic site) lyase [Gemmatimonas sp.]MCA2990191.1 bifunctional DNA-formamidopyrimidine glycosylase/DNA-(apurinic or apyrimidinic site) lyase [Gemmatimonas sp.]